MKPFIGIIKPVQAPACRVFNAVIFMTLSLLPGEYAWAGFFSVTPVRVYMTPRDRAVAVTVSNEGDTEVVLQADLNTWSQKQDGTDEQLPTEDLILSPPIIKLAPKARQVVRLALLKPADASRQLIYRMILREVPEAVPSRDQSIQMPIALALSLPVFITPPAAKREISCRAVLSDANALSASCTNAGSAYAQVREVLVMRDSQVLARFEGGTYILPGAQQAMGVKGHRAITSGPAQLRVSFDDGKAQLFDVVLP
ncbi:MAG: fimbria/pilus periplasmic chaperone [Burkholderiaceae bacterium]|nr:fimbria/pilus periplasmic chaperone [Burkholderiaceae bacterium]